MTLKAFAEQNGIGYNLAKQWRNRGKIVTEGDGYRLVTAKPVTVGAVTQLTVTDPQVTRLPVTAKLVTPASVTEPDRDIAVTLCPPVTPQAVTPESCAGCIVQSARLESCEHAIESLRSDMAILRDHVAALESLIADLKLANRAMVAGQLRHGQAVRRNGRTEIADGEYQEYLRLSEQ